MGLSASASLRCSLISLFKTFFPAAQWSLSSRSTVFSKAGAMFDLSSNQCSEVVLTRKRPTLLNPSVNCTRKWEVWHHRQRQVSHSEVNIILVVESRIWGWVPQEIRGCTLQAPCSLYQLSWKGWCKWWALSHCYLGLPGKARPNDPGFQHHPSHATADWEVQHTVTQFQTAQSWGPSLLGYLKSQVMLLDTRQAQ